MIHTLTGMVGDIKILFDLLYSSEIVDAEYFERGGYEVCRLATMDSYLYTRVEVPVRDNNPDDELTEEDTVVVTFSLPNSFILTLTFVHKEYELSDMSSPPEYGYARLYFSGIIDSAFDCKIDKKVGDLRMWKDVTMEQIEHDLTILHLTITKREPYEYE